MSYKEQIRKRIRELEDKIAETNVDKVQLESLRSELARLNMQEFEEDLHKHIHLENNILFPKAVLLEKEFAEVE